ncbi:hypothetical protein B0H14DRAFT_2619416 [Mycena olivaceomarginata]|nr:hypothetical protein B0H14DRAFT_2619416 [Mycena olivaceomarginata]
MHTDRHKDTCLTSIFSRSWLCLTCGRECLLRHPKLEYHYSPQFSAVTRFDKAKLEAALLSMSLLLQNPGSPEATKISPPVSVTPPCPTLSYTSTTDLPCHQILRYANSQLSQEVFRGLWAHGDPLLVTDVTQNFELAWDPDYFIANHGHDKCEIVDCQTNTSEQTTVRGFFKFFGQNSKRKKKIAGC